MNRVLYAILGVAALAPMTAAAAPSPTPSPSLDQLVAAPPSGFTELTSATFHGEFTAHYYATSTGSSDASAIEATLNHDGYVDGYGKSWVQASGTHALVDAVIAFSGGKGARDWLASAEIGDKADTTYKHPDTITGISQYYGGHFASTNGAQTDAFVFVKGNDVFLIAAVSQKDDALTLATAQATSQYNKAPAESIPTSQWPENRASTVNKAGWIPFTLIVVLVLVAAAVLLVGGLAYRSRRRTPVVAEYAAMPAQDAVPPVAPAGVQMSDDGRFWWDGQNWRDTGQEAPPNALRSSDGTQWWDGRNWRPVPSGPTAPVSSPF